MANNGPNGVGRPGAPTDAAERHLVVFQLGNELFGVDIGRVREIITMQPITRVPQAPEFVEGIINLRGRVIPVIDLRIRFGLSKGEANRATRVVVVEVGGEIVGMIVDAVSEVLRVGAEAVESRPAGTGHGQDLAKDVVKLPDRLIILLDVSCLTNDAQVPESRPEAAENDALAAPARA